MTRLDIPAEPTPVEVHGGIMVKRDDTYDVGGSRGGKVRTCAHLVNRAVDAGYAGIVTAGSRHSPQVNIVATLAARVGLRCRVHVPAGPVTPELERAAASGADVVQHRPGHNSVIVARAREDARNLGWFEVPFGMECAEAVRQTASQVASLARLPRLPRRIVIPVGSGMSAAGVLTGLVDADLIVPVLGVTVGASPYRRLDRFAPIFWQSYMDLAAALQPYHEHALHTRLGDLELDPVYEAKCLPFLEAGDLLWVVGIRATAGVTA